jgi:hypothetical protein
MLANMLRNTEWSQLGAFVTPAFFEVMPTGKLLARTPRLVTTRGSLRHSEALAQLARSLCASGLEQAQPLGADGLTLRGGAMEGPSERAARLVALYFHQLFHDGPTLLDLRPVAFSPGEHDLEYHPRPWIADWDSAFLTGLRQVYRGFYCNDDVCFAEGLAALGIAPCADLFRAHFGGDLERHVFRTRDFVSTFHQVFVRCRERGLKLHPDFLPLGIYLAALYDHLEQLDVAVDVRAAFAHATADAAQREAARTGRSAVPSS